MSTIVITNAAVDEDAAILVTKAYEMITPHWREIIPSLDVAITNRPFSRAYETFFLESSY